MKTTDTYHSTYYAAEALEWDNRTGIAVQPIDFRRSYGDADFTCEQFIVEFGAEFDGTWDDGVLCFAEGTDVVALLTALDAAYEEFCEEIFAEN